MRIHMVPLGTFPTIQVTLYLLFRKELHISRLISIKITITIPQTWVVNLKRTYNVCCEGTLLTTVCLLILILYGLSLKRIIIIFGHCSIFLYLFISFSFTFYSSPRHKTITHTGTITGARQWYLQSTSFFKNKIYIYICFKMNLHYKLHHS